MTTTRLSTKGQIIIPKEIRDARAWEPGMEFIFVETDDGLLLKPARPFPTTTVEDLLGSAGYQGPTLSLAEMEAAIAIGAQRDRD
ncbi:MAG: AbrB/MazE/SpoVT family DNA-binding domain-containing protein [Anaerolineales bacterium]|nr:AbrB/MazE/SpoVT family DNA-binding domain-containing protein [Anaerolineales bacterium]